MPDAPPRTRGRTRRQRASKIEPSCIEQRTATGLSDVQALVRGRLDFVVAKLGEIAVSDFSLIEDVNSYLQRVPGKLFRPTLLLLASEVEGDAPEEALTLGAAVELVHMATLVHDDAVDNSALRRGMPTVNSLWTHQVAIIMGDYLYSRAVTELARLGDLDAVEVLASAANAMSVGEMRQLLAHDDLSYGEDNYYRLISAKTASLISAACELGALAGAPAHRASLKRFGHLLGMAFQIADDMLDYVGDEEVTGKPAGLDLREHKVTLPLVGALRRMPPAGAARIRRLFGIAEPTRDDVAEAISLVRSSGGLEYAREKALAYAEAARGELLPLPPNRARDSLAEAVAYAVDRAR